MVVLPRILATPEFSRRRDAPSLSEDFDVASRACAIPTARRRGDDEAVLRVLVVEDDQDTAETFRTLPDLCGDLVVVARNS
jgi:hypothetical protein